MHRDCTSKIIENRGFAVGVVQTLLLSTAIGLLVPGVAAAQAISGAAPAAQAGDDTDTTRDIVVTAGKHEELLSKVAGGISVVTEKQLDDRGATSLTDYMALTPGVNVQSMGATGWGWVEVRGISPQSVGATVSTYIDEIPVGATSALSRSGEYTPDLDPSDLQRVEVLKGPQGTLYGASSLGGVIQYVTKGPSLTSTEIDTSEDLNVLNNGQFGYKVRGAITTPLITDVLGVRLSGFYRHDAGYTQQLGPAGIARDNANSGRDYGFRGAIRWKVTPDLTVDLTGSMENYKSNADSLVDLDVNTMQPLFADLGGGKDSNYRALDEYFAVKTDLISGTVKWATPIGTVTSATSYSYQKPGEQGDITPYYAVSPPNQPQNPDDQVSYLHPGGEIGSHLDKKTTEELRLNSNRLGPVEFIIGGFYQHEFLHDGGEYVRFLPSGQIDTTTPDGVGLAWRSGTLNEYAGFFNITYHLTEKLDVTGGYRHSYIDQTRSTIRGGYIEGANVSTYQKFSENADTYLGQVRWRPTDEITVYARAASGYRPGGGRSIPPGAPADFGTTYSSDSIWSYEAGVKYRTPDGKFTLDADGYWINWKDIQALVNVGFYDTDGNGGTARSRGLEMSATYAPVRGLNLYANGAYTDAVFTQDAASIGATDGARLFYIPKWTATIGGDYAWALSSKWNASIGGDYAYRSSQFDTNFHALPSYTMISLHAGVETSKYSINLYVKNAANKHVIIGDTGYFPQYYTLYDAVYTPPRQIGVTFSQKF